jgi:hypothetical protein
MENEELKKPWMSKTLWVALIMAVAPLFPPIGVFVAANPATVSLVVGAVFAGLRLITATGIKVK